MVLAPLTIIMGHKNLHFSLEGAVPTEENRAADFNYFLRLPAEPRGPTWAAYTRLVPLEEPLGANYPVGSLGPGAFFPNC